MTKSAGIRIAIDRGGTFTDCIATCPGREDLVLKLLSVDPSNYKDAPTEAIRRVLEFYNGIEIDRKTILDLRDVEFVRMGTTVATNALLERKGERSAFVTTKGFRDLLIIGNQSRPKIFDLAICRPEVLYEEVLEIEERVTLEDYTEDPIGYRTAITKDNDNITLGESGEVVRIMKRPDVETIQQALQTIFDKGIQSLAVCFTHSYTFPEHEKLVGQIAKKIGFKHISLSHELSAMIKMVPRATSTMVDAYLTPEIKRYTEKFQSSFEDSSGSCRIEFMQSDGGLVDIGSFSGLKAILSGPAGGVVGYAQSSYDPENKTPVIGFDMGGTSTDVSRYGGEYEHVFETTVAGVTVQTPQLDIQTVAAGGGSRLFWKNGLFVVGPESAGAHPGPACYRKGGPLTVTDANLVLGRLRPEFFPKIFGPNEDQSLDVTASLKLFEELATQINADMGSKLSVAEVAHGFIKVANEAMARPIRALTEAKGHNLSDHRLASFGGAGGQHAVAIADALKIKQTVIHKYSSILSAYGISLADVVYEKHEPASLTLGSKDMPIIKGKLDALSNEVCAALRQRGFSNDKITCQLYLDLRYKGTESSIMVLGPKDGDFKREFISRHEYQYGFTMQDRPIIVESVRVRGIGSSSVISQVAIDKALKESVWKSADDKHIHSIQPVFFDDHFWDTAIYRIDNILPGTKISGPTILADNTQTIVVPPGSEGFLLDQHVVVNRAETSSISSTRENDPILLSIFGHRFMAIAEQMGTALRQTSVSSNIKERLDFSCAIFDPEGSLVANAPHLPVHLGSMSAAVRLQAEHWRGNLFPGDVLVSNHPQFGGTHLPDITVITPVFNGGEIVFFVASRAHHADIGSISAGSMPPGSKELFQEGAAIKSEKLVSKGIFNEERITELLCVEPAKYPGCSGTRRLSDNLSDLKAQIAANRKGISLLDALFAEYGQKTVISYMIGIQKNAELAVRNVLKRVADKYGNCLSASDYMDDGSKINLKVTIDKEDGSAIFDFDGTSKEVYGNINAPEAVTFSAVIYCLRCLISEDMPLNQGCLKPVDIRIPKGSLLSPSDGAAVVGGNVLTSQRVTDVILKLFEACAASQGDCNNLTFGIGGQDKTGKTIDGWGYYETIAGGSGAGPTWNGTSGVHTHMTNTRITDPEVFERRYPVILHKFSLRPGSGGKGKYNGGDGVIRDIEFRIPVQCSILSERRVFHPYGMKGGENAATGYNEWVRVNGRSINLGSKNTFAAGAGDRIVIHTPGGGGFGSPEEA